jgi:hypothetical protein
VGQSLRYLAEQHGMVGKLMGRTYEPHLLETITLDPRSAGLDTEGIHVFFLQPGRRDRSVAKAVDAGGISPLAF